MTAGVAGRYASALFDLANEQNQLDEVDRDLGKFQGLLDQSEDLSRLVKSPAFAAEEQERALGAVMDWAAIGATTGNFLKVVTRNRRLFAAEDMITTFRALLARHRGEVAARGAKREAEIVLRQGRAARCQGRSFAAGRPRDQDRQPHVRFLAQDQAHRSEGRAEGHRLTNPTGRRSARGRFDATDRR